MLLVRWRTWFLPTCSLIYDSTPNVSATFLSIYLYRNIFLEGLLFPRSCVLWILPRIWDFNYLHLLNPFSHDFTAYQFSFGRMVFLHSSNLCPTKNWPTPCISYWSWFKVSNWPGLVSNFEDNSKFDCLAVTFSCCNHNVVFWLYQKWSLV